jgi:hypothetical protein
MGFEHLPFACIDCGARGETDEECPTCGADGMMDLRDEHVREELRREDEARAATRRHQMIVPALPFGLPVILFFSMGGQPLCGGAAGLAITYALSLVLAAIFPAKTRFPYVSDRRAR